MSWQSRRTDRKRRRFSVELLEDRRLLAGDISQVGYFDTWDGGVIRSTDIAGIAYHPSGRLYLADSEINELPSIFNGDNVFETSLSGDQVFRGIASGNDEPTGITFNEFDGQFYVTNDTGDKLVTRYDSNLNNPLYEFAPQDDMPGAVDPEGITSDPSTGFLYVADGNAGDRQVLIYSLDLSNPNEATRDVIFQGAFSVADQMGDAEGIAFHEPSGHLFLIDGTQDLIFEYTTAGRLVQEYDISRFSPKPSTPQGLTFGPTSSASDDPSALSLYIADGGSDNFPDGGVYEAVVDVNLPPVLAAIGAQSVDEGSPLTFTALATDMDPYASNFSFSLDSGAPAGATINSATGEFSWIPTEAEGPAVHSVTVRVTQDGAPALEDFETINITVGEVNQAPVFAAIGNKSVDEGVLLTFTASVADADLPANNLSFSLDTGAPAGATIDPSTGQFSWTPTEVQGPAVYSVTVRVTDDGVSSLDDVQTFEITVGEVNQAPELAVIGNKSVDEGSLITFAASATDADLPANNLSFSLDTGAPAGATIDPSTGQFSWTPPGLTSPGIHTLTIRVTDDGVPSLDDFETITITVNDVNLPPVLASIGEQNVDEGNTLTFTASATDPDLSANFFSFSLDSDAPAGATINSTTGEFSWTPTETEGPAVYSVTVRVTEDGMPTLNGFETITITVAEVDQAPELAVIGNQSIDEGSLLTFTASATDADLPLQNLSFSLDAGAPQGATIHPSTGQFSWTPPGGTSLGDHTVTIRVSDDSLQSLDDFETITITVNDVNLPPVLAAISNKVVEEGGLLTFTAQAIDLDQPADSFSFSLDSDAPAGATIDATTGEFNWAPGETEGPAVYSVTVRVTEDGAPTLDDFQTINITVSEVNQAPVLAAIGDQSVDEGSLLAFTVSATDADLPANKLSFSLDSGAPAGATIDPTTGEFSWTPTEAQGPAVHSVTVRVTDDGTPNLEDFETINITVGEVNRAPELAAIGNRSVDEGSPLTFTASAIDPDLPASNFSFSLDSDAPAGATIDPSTGQFSWTPPGGTSPGIHTVTVRVSEDGASSLDDFETITITVNDVNLAPVLAVIGGQSVEEGSLLTFTVSATDLDQPADQLSFSLDSDAPAGATIDPATGEFNWTPGEAEGPAVHSVTVRVTDDGTPSRDHFETVNITVGEVNQAPELAAIGDMQVDEGSPLIFTASATDADFPANELSFSLDANAPLGAIIDSSTGQFSWTPPGGTSPGNHTVTIRVSDDGLQSLDDFETITITVNDVNLPPVLAAIGGQSVGEGSTLTFTASAIDLDQPADQLSFSLDPGAPAGATINPNTGEFSWTPPELELSAVYSVTVRVTDDGTPSLEDFETINLTVREANQPPVLAAIGSKSIDEGSLLTFTASATDTDLPANNLSFSLDSGAPVGATIDSNTGEFRWTPAEAQGPAVHSVTVRVTDDGLLNLDDFETFEITVGEVNQAPELAVIGNRSVDEGSLLSFTVAATDPDLPANNLSFSLDSGAPDGATIDPSTGQFSWMPPGGTSPGNHTVTIRVSDDGLPSLDDFETITITVNDVNLPPVLAAIDAQSVDEGSLLTFTASAIDPDLPASNFSFSLDSDAPLGATIDPSTGQFSWTPPGGTSLGDHTVTVRVTDDGLPSLDDFVTFTITVTDVNLPPVLAVIGVQSVEEGSLLTFTAAATDLDQPADNFSFSLDSDAPAGATINPITGEFSWTPGEAEGPAVYPVTVRVTEDGTPTLHDFETINITVVEVNQAPELAAIGDKSLDEGSLLTFTATATDADFPANNLSFSLDSDAPAGATIDPTTGQFSWTPAETQGPAVYSVTVRVTDDGTPGLDDFETINITVGEINQAPELATIGNRSVDEGSLLTFTATATDADFPANNLSFSLDSGAPAGATIDSTTGEFNWTPGFLEHPAVYSVTVRVTDDGMPTLDDFQTFDITVREVNQAPVLATISNKSIDEGSLVTFTASASDSDLPANNLFFSLGSGAPAGATIDPSTGEFSWTPTETQGPAVHSVTVRVTDDGTPTLDDFQTFDITVGEVNQAPVLAAIGNRSVDEGSLLSFTVSAIDADFPANNLSFSLDASAPLGATIDPSTGQFSWTPPGGTSPGIHTVTVRVTDDGVPSLDDFETFTVTVNDVNLPPVLASIGGQSVEEGSVITFTASATDADLPANNLSFSLDSDAPAGATIDATTGEFNWTPPELDGPAVFSVTVRVTDDETPSLDDFETINIMVLEVNQPPVLAAIGNKSVDEGSLLTFAALATDADLPVNNLTFSLDSGAPAGATIDPSTGQFSWTPPGGTSPGNHTVTIRVTDDGVPILDDFETITITVNDVNLPPVLSAIGTHSVVEGSPLTFTASATDPDLPADNLSFSLDANAPLSATIDPSTGEFSWTPGEAYGSAVFSITVRVTDDGTPSLDDRETFNVTVREFSQAPILAAIGNKRINEGNLLTFTASATDPDFPAKKLSFSLDSGAPAGATINATTGEFNWMPAESQGPAVYSVTVRVTKDGTPSLEDFETFQVTVREANRPPVLAAIGNKSVDEGSLLTFTASATDPDLPANELSFSLDSGAPAGATIDSITGEFRWTPTEAEGPAVHSVTVRVTDDDVSTLDDFETIDIAVGEVNQAPLLAAIGNLSIDEGSLLTFTASATDSDLPVSNLSFSLDSGAPLGATIDPSTGQFSWTPPVGTSPGNHTVTVRVSEDDVPSLDDFETINIMVIPLPPRDPLDVNHDGRVTVLDALAIINQLSRMLTSDNERVVGSVDQALSDYDANGDGKVSALDALLVINHISITNQEAESALDGVIQSRAPVTPAPESWLDDDLIRLLADDNIIAGLGKHSPSGSIKASFKPW